MNRSDRARLASWMQVPCPECHAAAGQRCLMPAGTFRAIFHAERAVERKPVQNISAEAIAGRRSA